MAGGVANGVLGQRLIVDIGEELAGAIQWQQMIGGEVDGQGLEAGAILHQLADLRRKGGGGGLPTMGAAFTLDLMGGDFNLDGRQVEHLALVVTAGRFVL